MRRTFFGHAVTLAAILVTSAAVATPAAAGPGAGSAAGGSGAAEVKVAAGTQAKAHDRTVEILGPCIAQARRAKADAWTCTAAGLTTVTRGVDGKPRQSFTPVAARTLAPEPVSTLQDDYDTWCESSGVCHRNPFGNKFLEETKGNAAYGTGTDVTGTFDIILRTNLNGRQARWRETFIWDSGPGVSFEVVFANCWEVIDLWPDLNCGNHYGGSRRIGPGAARWDTPTLFGNRLVNSADYYGAVTGLFTTDAEPVRLRAIAPLETTRFQCPGTLDCVFY